MNRNSKVSSFLFCLLGYGSMTWCMDQKKKAFLYDMNKYSVQEISETTLSTKFPFLAKKMQKKMISAIIQTNNIPYLMMIMPQILKNCRDYDWLWNYIDEQHSDNFILLFMRYYCRQKNLICS